MTPLVSIRLDLPGGRIGPGKVALLEAVAREGSISAAGRAMGMSYRRAWTLIAELNRVLGGPVVNAAAGGTHGGGASLTPLGQDVVARYRRIEAAAARAAARQMRALERG